MDIQSDKRRVISYPLCSRVALISTLFCDRLTYDLPSSMWLCVEVFPYPT